MSTPESAGLPLEEAEDNVVPFAAHEVQDTETREFEELFLSTLLSEENFRFLLDQAKELGVDFRIILNAAVESYAPLYELHKQGRPIFYLGEDRRMHQMNGDPDEPKAV